MGNPTLPPSLAAEFAEIKARLRALEMGESNLSYRQPLTTNDASNARVLHSADGNAETYAAALVNPKYDVLVARFHVVLFGSSAANVWLRADMNGLIRTTQVWHVTGKPAPAWAFHQFEIAWLHGMPTQQWADVDEDTVIRRGNIQFRAQVTADHAAYFRNPNIDDDMKANGFADNQLDGNNAPRRAVLGAWFAQKSNLYECYFREPEYVFLAPRSSFPTATIEGTLIPGSVIDT